MKRLLSTLLLALGTAALAAPATAATTCYVGGALGFSALQTPIEVMGMTYVKDAGTTGISGGITGGCDWRAPNSWLLGGWADLTWHDADVSLDMMGMTLLQADIERQWSLGARAGYFVADNILLYGLIGWTRVDVSDLTGFGLGSSLPVDSMNGVVLGGGVEFDLMPNISLATEYRYTNLGKESLVQDAFLGDLSAEPEIHTARAVLKYKFDVAR